MSDGHKQLITPYNTSEFHEMVRAVRGHTFAMNDQAREVAAELNKLLPTAKGKRMAPIRIDQKIMARRVTRHIVHFAACQLAAGRSMTLAYTTYLDLFTNQGGGSHGRTFDIDA